MQNASELLAPPPALERIDVLAAKLPQPQAEKALDEVDIMGLTRFSFFMI